MSKGRTGRKRYVYFYIDYEYEYVTKSVIECD